MATTNTRPNTRANTRANTRQLAGTTSDARGTVDRARRTARGLLFRADRVRFGRLGAWGLSALGGWSAAAVSLAALVLNPASALAGPEGEQIVRGDVTFARNGNETIIRASNNSIINYRSFDIGSTESVRFIQPDAAARVLNRINSAAPTRIDGGLFANGRVYIVNPSGVIFGRNAVVDVAGLHAAAGRMSDRDFLRGRDRFTNLTGQVVNEGRITTSDIASLVGKSVLNAGSISAPEGTIVMAAGDSVMIGPREGGLMVRVEGAGLASEGKAAVQNDGTLDTRSASGRSSGRVTMAAGDVWGVALGTGSNSRIASRDVRIEGQGKGVVEVRGEIDARNTTQVDSQSRGLPTNAGKGGQVRVLGEYVAIEGATIDASGATGGGTVLVGGNYLGQGPERNATATYVAPGSTIRADATDAGNGGRVIVWSDTHTGYYGTISARGMGRGDGGFVETSGKDTLDIRGGRVDARAGELTGPDGKTGTNGQWLLDPRNVSITNTENNGGFAPSGGFNRFTPTGNSAQVDVDDIVASLEGGTNVEIITGTGGTQDGNITVNATILKDSGGSATLLLRAANNIEINSSITSSSGALTVDLRAGDATNGNDATSVVGQGNVNFNGSATITTNGGNFLSSGNAFTIADGSTNAVDTGAGALTINHTGAVTLNRDLSSGIGNISVTGASFLMDNGATVVSADGSVAISAAGLVDIQRPVIAGTTLTVTSGTGGGNNNIVFNSAQATLAGSTITLRAGNGGTTSQVNFTNLSSIRGADNTGNPGTFNIVQDAAISTLPAPAIFNGGAVTGINYGIQTGSTLLLDDAARVAGANLTLNGTTSVTINDATTDPFSVGSLTINGTNLVSASPFVGGTVTIAEATTASGAFFSSGTTFVNSSTLSAASVTLEHSGNVDIDATVTLTGTGGFISNRTSETAGTFDSAGFAIVANNQAVTVVAPLQTVTLGGITSAGVVTVGGAGITLDGTVGAVSAGLTSTAGVTVNQAVTVTGSAGFVSSGTTFDSAADGDIDATNATGIVDLNHTGIINTLGDLRADGAVTVDGAGTTIGGAVISDAANVAIQANGGATINAAINAATNAVVTANDALAVNASIDAGSSAGNTIRLNASADGGNDSITFGSNSVLLSASALFFSVGNSTSSTGTVDFSGLAGGTNSFRLEPGDAGGRPSLTIVQDASITGGAIPTSELAGGTLQGVSVGLQSNNGSVLLDTASLFTSTTTLTVNGATGVTLNDTGTATFNLSALFINGTNVLGGPAFSGGAVTIADAVVAAGSITSAGTTFDNSATVTGASIALEHSGDIGIAANVTATGVGGVVSNRTGETSGNFNSSLATINGGTGPVTAITNGSNVVFGPITNAGAITATGTTVTQAGTVSSSTSYTITGGAVSINTPITLTGAFSSSGTTFTNTGTISASGVTLEHSGAVNIDNNITITGAGGFLSDRTSETAGIFDSTGFTIAANNGLVTIVHGTQNITLGGITSAGAIALTGGTVTQSGAAFGTSYTINASNNAALNANITANNTVTPANSTIVVNAGSDGTGNVTAGAVELRGQSISFRAGDGAAGGGDAGAVSIGSATLASRDGATRPDSVTIRQDASIVAADVPLLSTITGGSVTGMLYTLRSDAGSVAIGANAARVAGSRLTLSALSSGQAVSWTSDLAVESLLVDGRITTLSNGVTASNGDIVLNLQDTTTTLGAGVTLSAATTGNGTGLIDINSTAANALDLSTNALTLRGAEVDLDGLGTNAIIGGVGSAIAFETATAVQPINVGSPASPLANALDITDADLATLDESIAQVTIGRADGAHAEIRVASSTFRSNTLIRTPAGGLVNLVGQVDNPTSLASLSFIGNTFASAGAGITTTDGLVDFQSPVFLNTGTFVVDTGSASGASTGSVRVRQGADLDFLASGNTLRLITGTVQFDLANGVTGTNSVVDLRPEVTNGSIRVGSGVGSGDLNVDSSVLAGLADGFGALNLGTSGGAHAITLGTFAIRDPLSINLGVGGSVAIGGTITNAASTVGDVGNLSITSPAITLGVGAGGAIDFTAGSVTLNGPVVVNDAAARSIATDTGTIDINGTVEGSDDDTANLTLDAGTGDIIFRGAVGTTNRLQSLTIANVRDVNPVAAIAGTPSLIRVGTLTQSAGTGTSRFGQIVAGATGGLANRVLLTGNAFSLLGTVATTATGRSGSMVVDNAGTLTVGGAISLNGAFTQQGDGLTVLGAAINTSAGNGNITFDASIGGTTAAQGVRLDATTLTLNAGTGTIRFADALNLQANGLTLVGDEIDFGSANSITGTGATLALRPSADSVTIGVGGGAGTLDLSDADLLAIANNALSLLTIGSGTHTGDVTVGTSSDGALFRNATTIRTDTGALVVNGTIVGADADSAITLQSGNPATLNAGVRTAGAAISITGGAVLGTGLSNFANVATLDTTNAGAVATGASVTIGAAIDAATLDTQSLTINAGTTGDVALNGAIGLGTRLNTLTITNANEVNRAADVASPFAINALGFTQAAGTGLARYGTITATTGGVSIASDSIALLGDVTGTGGAVSIIASGVGQSATLSGDRTIQTTGAFDITLGRIDGDGNALTVTSGDDITFQRSVTDLTALNAVGETIDIDTGAAISASNGVAVSGQGSVNVNGSITVTGAGNSLSIAAGLDDTGSLNFGEGSALNASDITLFAGDGLAGTNTGAVNYAGNGLTTRPTFGGANGVGRPTSFLVVQDASIADADIALASQFGGALSGSPAMTYSLVSRGGSVTVSTASKVAGANLTLEGAVGGAIIGGDIAPSAITFNSAATVNENITTSASGGIVFDNAATFGTGVVLTAAGAEIAFNGAANFGSSTVELRARDVQFAGGAGSVTGSGATLTLAPDDTSVNVRVGGATDTADFDVTQGELALLTETGVDRFTLLTIGDEAGEAQLFVDGDSSFFDPVRLTMNGLNGRMNVNNRVIGRENASVNLRAQDLRLGDSVLSDGQAITLTANGALLTADDVLLSTTQNGAAAGANIRVETTLNADDVTEAQNNNRDLTINAGTAGTVLAQGAIGNTAAISSLSVTGAASGATRGIDVFAARTFGAQSYSAGLVAVREDLTSLVAGAITVGGNLLLDGPSTADTRITTAGGANDDVSITGAIDINAGGGPRELIIDVGSGDILVGGNIGVGSPLAERITNFSATGATINVRGVTTSGAQTFNGATTLGGDALGTVIAYNGATILATDATLIGTTSVTFNGTLDSEATETNALVVNSPLTRFNGSVGVTDALSTLTTDAAGTTRFGNNGAAVLVRTTGEQAFGDAALLDADATFTSTTAGVSFASTVDSVNAARAMTVNTGGAGPGGVTRFGGAVGAGSGGALASLTTNADGTTRVNTSVTTLGDQVYNDALILESDTVLTGANLTLAQGVDSASTPQNLTLAATNLVSVNANSGAGVGLQNLLASGAAISVRSVRSSNAQTFNGPLTLNGTLQSVSAGAITINGGLTLGGASALVTNGAGADDDITVTGAIAGGGFNLNANSGAQGAVAFNSNASGLNDVTVLGNAITLANLAATGGAALGGSGTASLNTGALTVGSLNAFGNAITIASSTSTAGTIINGPGTVNAGALSSGSTLSVSGGTLTLTTLNSTGDTTLSATAAMTASGAAQSGGAFTATGPAITLANVTAGGDTTLGTTTTNTLTTGTLGVTGALTARGASINLGNATVSSDATIQGTTINPGATTTVGGNLLVSGLAGDTSRASVVNLRTTTATGNQTVRADSIVLSGNQGSSTSGRITFDGPVVLATDSTVASGSTSNGPTDFAIAFVGPVNSQSASALRSLTLNTPGGTRFQGAVGGTTRLANLTTDAGGTTRFEGGSVTTQNDQVYGDAVVLTQSTTFAGNDVAFGSTLDASGSDTVDLFVNTTTEGGDIGETTFGGNVGSTRALRRLVTNADGNTTLNGVMTTTQEITFNDAVFIAGNSTIQSSGLVAFLGRRPDGSVINASASATDPTLTISSAFNPSITLTDPASFRAPIRVNGSIGTERRLGALAFSGALNGAARSASPSSSTIVFTDAFRTSGDQAGTIDATLVQPLDAFRVVTGAGGFSMTTNEKILALGAFRVDTLGTAFVSDINAITTIDVNASAITIRGRSAGAPVLSLSLNDVLEGQNDLGTDFVANDRIAFNAPTNFEGVGSANQIGFAVSDLIPDPLGAITINGSTVTSFDRGVFQNGVTLDLFQVGSGAQAAILPLDLRFGGSNPNVATALAGAIPRDQETRQVTTPVTVSQALREPLLEMGVSVKDLTTEQIITFLVGRSIYVDVPNAVPSPEAADYQITPNRLSNAAALRAIEAYSAISKKQVTEEDGTTRTRTAEEVVGILERSWEAYAISLEGTNQTPTGAGWRAWLESRGTDASADDTQSLEVLNLTNVFFRRIDELNLSPREARIPKEKLITEIRPTAFDELTPEEFVAAVGVSPLVSAPSRPATDPASNPAEVEVPSDVAPAPVVDVVGG